MVCVKGQIADLEKDIEVMKAVASHYDSYLTRDIYKNTFNRVLKILTAEKAHCEHRLLAHNQRVKERGIKF